jgi:hypothetical protein
METVLDDTTGSAALTTLRNDLLLETAPAADDEVFLRDTSALTVDRITLADLLKVIAQLTAETAPATGDLLALYDTSAGTTDKITLADALKVIGSLTGETAPAVNDALALYDTSAGTTDSILLSDLLKVIDGLTAETAPAIDDQLAVYDTSAGTADKLALSDLFKVINGLTTEATPDPGADYVVIYDASSGTAKKVLFGGVAGTKYYASVTFGTSATVAFTVTLAAFAPVLPVGTTVVSTIEVYCTRGDSSAPGAGASVFGFAQTIGAPFGGTNPAVGVYKNVNINDKINVNGSANNAAGGSGTVSWLFVATI